MEREFLDFIASILEVDVVDLSFSTTYGSIQEWDSLMHIRLVAEIYEKYDVDIPIDEVSNIKTIGGFYKYIESI